MNLADLFARDLSTVETDELVSGVKDARTAEDNLLANTGALIRELRARGLSWSRLVALTSVPQTTLWRLAQTEPPPPTE
ncbi:MAG: hypothetical protein AB7I38_18810 [Dehalococcoidia bacterium]